MKEYTRVVTIHVTVSAPDEEDVDTMLEDHYGVGSSGEGVTVTSMDYDYD